MTEWQAVKQPDGGPYWMVIELQVHPDTGHVVRPIVVEDLDEATAKDIAAVKEMKAALKETVAKGRKRYGDSGQAIAFYEKEYELQLAALAKAGEP